jgi:hypothetical protein
MIQFCRRRVTAVAMGSLLLAVTGAITGNAAAASAPCCPPVDRTFYVAPGDGPATAYNLGLEQANADGQSGQPSIVILDFGAQRDDGAGNYLPSTTYFWSDGTIEFYAANFAEGYQNGGHGAATLQLALGTSNGGSVTDGALGAIWGSVVQAVVNNASSSGYVNVNVAGSGDWEAGYGPFAHLAGWVNGDSSGGGYVSTEPASLYDFGSADGCPGYYNSESQNLQCDGDWTQDSNWLASWGWGPAYATPQIYYNGVGSCTGLAAQDIQWGMISLEGAVQHGRSIYFTGPLTSAGTCDTTLNAWIDLWNVINNNSQTAMTPLRLLQINTD